jgi:iron complex outermembrane recepter protein
MNSPALGEFMSRADFAILCAALIASSLIAPARAQTVPTAEDEGIGEIVVTAQRREQSLMSVPVAVTALSNDVLQDRGIQNSADLATVVPNLEISSPFGATQPNFSLRGVSVANEYNSNQVSPIGVYVNDVYLVSRTSQGMGLFDLDRVEVLRGPQGTLFGRNTTGGAINFITRTPGLDGDNGYVEAGYGNFSTFTVQGANETTFASNQMGLRVAINYANGNGAFENVFPGGHDPDSTDTLQGRISARFKPEGSAFDIKVVAYGAANNPTQAPVFGLLPYREGLDYYEVDENRIGNNKTTSYGISTNVAYTVSPILNLISITSYDRGFQDLHQAADGSPLDVLDIEWGSHFGQFSEELRANYAIERLTAIAGVYYGTDTTITNNTFDIGSLLGPGVNGGFFQHYDQDRRSYAGFTQMDLNLTSALVLTLGARYTSDHAYYNNGSADLFLGDVGAPQTPLATTVPCPTAPGTCPYDPDARYDLRGKNDATAGRAALSYTLDDGTLTYVSYNRGYRAGAFNGGGYTSSGGINYVQPESVDAYEVGAKTLQFDRRVSVAVAGFYYNYKNQQVQDTRAGPVSFLVNAPKSEIYGAELESQFKANQALSLHFSAGFTHATYSSLTLQGVNLHGNDLPFAPRLTAQAGMDWHFWTLAGGALALSPTVAYTSHQYFSPFDSVDVPGGAQDNAELQQFAYTKVNANLSWTRNQWVVKAWANNLFNRTALDYGLDLRGAGFPYNFLVPQPPRTYGINFKYSY